MKRLIRPKTWLELHWLVRWWISPDTDYCSHFQKPYTNQFLQAKIIFNTVLFVLANQRNYFYITVTPWEFFTWSFTGVCDSKSPGPFSVFWLILMMLWSGWLILALKFLSLLVCLRNLWELFQVHQLQLVSLLPSCSIVSSRQRLYRYCYMDALHGR